MITVWKTEHDPPIANVLRIYSTVNIKEKYVIKHYFDSSATTTNFSFFSVVLWMLYIFLKYHVCTMDLCLLKCSLCCVRVFILLTYFLKWYRNRSHLDFAFSVRFLFCDWGLLAKGYGLVLWVYVYVFWIAQKNVKLNWNVNFEVVSKKVGCAQVLLKWMRVRHILFDFSTIQHHQLLLNRAHWFVLFCCTGIVYTLVL